eukprot:EG_transcript_7523
MHMKKRACLCFGLTSIAVWNGRVALFGKEAAHCDVGDRIDGLPEYSAADVAAHDRLETGVWVIYRSGVYDITDFIARHPGGGEKVSLAAGGYIDPFWQYYQQHQKPSTKQLLEEMRIGNLRPTDVLPASSLRDPYINDPVRPAALKVHSEKPFNAETPAPLLTENFLTPNDVFYIRNHMPVPHVDAQSYELEVSGVGIASPLNLTLQDLQEQFPKHCVDVTFSCAGNRRTDMEEYKHVKGLDWGPGGIGTARWCGAKLVDVLRAAAFDISQGAQHIQFDGMDVDVEGNSYNVSIPIQTASSPEREVLLAYEMNGQPIPVDHGFPVRAVVPGTTGARSVKWLARVVASEEEAQGHFQQKDYKVWTSNVNFGDALFDAPAIQEMPVQSAICKPTPSSTIPRSAEHIELSGYAYSGGGRDIARVEVSTDGGNTWQLATMLPRESAPPPPHSFWRREWSWVLWSAKVAVPRDRAEVDLCCRAVDVAYNTQPESPAAIWNMRGLLTNSWHHVVVRREGVAVAPAPSPKPPAA